MENRADIGIIGGMASMIQNFLVQSARSRCIHLMARLLICNNRRIFRSQRSNLPCHGRGHRIPPHMINNRANIWALQELESNALLPHLLLEALKKISSLATLQFLINLLTSQKTVTIHSTMEGKYTMFL